MHTLLHVHTRSHTQQIESLIQVMDPAHTGHITFNTFRQGIETYLVGKNCHQRLELSHLLNVNVPKEDLLL